LFGLLAIALTVVGIVYLTTTSVHLPSYLPGHFERAHAAGQLAQAHKHHVKLGIASFVLAALALVAAWYSAAPDRELR
jgi:uncharacterized membrane protein